MQALAVVTASLMAGSAAAADVNVSCEKRSNRSRISVDGHNLAPCSYRAVWRSGTRSVTTQFETADGDEAEFDFDSSRNDIAEGANAIAASLVVDARVRGYIVNSSNQRVAPIVEAICRVRR